MISTSMLDYSSTVKFLHAVNTHHLYVVFSVPAHQKRQRGVGLQAHGAQHGVRRRVWRSVRINASTSQTVFNSFMTSLTRTSSASCRTVAGCRVETVAPLCCCDFIEWLALNTSGVGRASDPLRTARLVTAGCGYIALWLGDKMSRVGSWLAAAAGVDRPAS